MATEQEVAEVKRMIEAFYQFAGISITFNLEVNESVAAVFGTMLRETRTCSRAFGWIPTPPAGQASIVWLAMQLGRGVFNSYRSQLSLTCARHVINVWGGELQSASMGLTSGRLPTWA